MADNERKATIHFAGNDFFVGVTPSGHAQTIESDSHRGRAATPMELVLLALGGCTGVDVISILKKKRQHVTDYRIVVHGDRRKDFPRAYIGKRLSTIIPTIQTCPVLCMESRALIIRSGVTKKRGKCLSASPEAIPKPGKAGKDRISRPRLCSAWAAAMKLPRGTSCTS